MSTPHVSGVAALVRSQAPHLSAAQVAKLLKETAQDLGPQGADDDFGAGLVDARAALDALGGAAPPAEPPAEETPAPEPAPRPGPGRREGNQAPVADAGPDATVTVSRGLGRALVQLDGSGSRDPDGRLAKAVWLEDGRAVATGLTPTLALRPGEHVLTLVVRDEEGALARDTVTVTVRSGR